MRYVILRDDDTNALTPVAWLERLYRPFLDRGLPVNLATIPNVGTTLTLPDGKPEGLLVAKQGAQPPNLPIGRNPELVSYLLANPLFTIVQHGFDHHYFEFDRTDASDIARRLDEGTRLLLEAGFARPQSFVAPYDKLSRASLVEVARRFRVLSTGWFELRRLPYAWWPGYFRKKAFKTPHWQIGQTRLLTHPGCLLSYHRPYPAMLESIRRSIESRSVTVLVTHWWEYYRENRPDEAFIEILHETAEFLAHRSDVQVISFNDVAEGRIKLN
jgi:hypothetical protein